MKKSEVEVYRYEHWINGLHLYNVDIVNAEDTYESWLSRVDIGISVLLFSVLKHDCHFWDFLEIVEKNLNFYIDEYEREYISAEDSVFHRYCSERFGFDGGSVRDVHPQFFDESYDSDIPNMFLEDELQKRELLGDDPIF